MKIVDLRSDTVTRPTAAMRKAMAEAEVGDDVYGEDPTVNRLEAMAAERLDKEAGLFVVSGTMGNLVSLLAQCGRGDEIILGDRQHTFMYEQGGMAALGGIVPRLIPNQDDGTLRLDNIAAAIRGDNIHYPRTRLICLENTHNLCYGSPLTATYTAQVASLAHEHGLRLHIDGARIFNAEIALGVPAAELVRGADSVTFCLSKGLSAPVGAVVCGDRDFITEARRARKGVGGGMRQAGIIAAAGIVALEQMIARLADDHARAKQLADGLAVIPGLSLAPVHTNLVYFSLCDEVPMTASEVSAKLESLGVRILSRGDHSFRAVTHVWIDDEDIERTITAMRKVIG